MYRLPRTWAVCEAGEAEIWVARQVAKRSRHLPLRLVGVVDAAVSRIIASEAGGRVIAVAEAKVIEAAPGLHEQRVEEEKRRRYVGFSRTDEAGLRTVIARVQAGDAAWVKATVERVAEIITPQHVDATADEVRAIAFGYLARPAELLALLLEHTDDAQGSGCETSGHPEPEQGEPNRAIAFPADLLEALRGLDLSRLAPRCSLYVHLHEAVLHGADGVARVEGLGAVTLAQLQELLGRARVVVKPVIDLCERVRSTAYEHPESLKERIHLTTCGDYWPYASATSRCLDYDHPTPYADPVRGGPPGQTGTHNSGPLGRRHHRWKTHAGYRSRQAGHGRYAWLTPHGLGYLVDHRGTRPIDHDDARMIIDASPSLDIYPSDLTVEIDLQPTSVA